VEDHVGTGNAPPMTFQVNGKQYIATRRARARSRAASISSFEPKDS
jgi:hypothetical protein